MAKKRSSGTTPSTSTSTSNGTASSRRPARRTAATTSSAPAAIDGSPVADRSVADLATASTAAEMSTTEPPALSGHGPSVDEIAVAAYHRYLQRGAQDGYALEDWIAAEHDLRQRSSR